MREREGAEKAVNEWESEESATKSQEEAAAVAAAVARNRFNRGGLSC